MTNSGRQLMAAMSALVLMTAVVSAQGEAPGTRPA